MVLQAELAPHSNVLCRNFPPTMNMGAFMAMFRKVGSTGRPACASALPGMPISSVIRC